MQSSMTNFVTTLVAVIHLTTLVISTHYSLVNLIHFVTTRVAVIHVTTLGLTREYDSFCNHSCGYYSCKPLWQLLIYPLTCKEILVNY